MLSRLKPISDMLLLNVKTNKFQSFFIFVLFLSIFYIAFIKTQFYRSSANIIIKNTDTAQISTSILGLVSSATQDGVQDALVLQEYLKSYEMFNKVDKEFELSKYYLSDDLDILKRMTSFSSHEDFIALYNKHLGVIYDEISGIITISFLHIDAKQAKNITHFLINEVEKQLNRYDQQRALKELRFIEQESEKQKIVVNALIEKLETYQNKQKTLDPKLKAKTNSSILSGLKVNLVEKEAKLKKISEYMTDNAFEIVDLKREIKLIEKSIKNLEKEQSGSDKDALNKKIFEYEKIKKELDLNTEIYKQALLRLQSAKIEAIKNKKVLQILVNPNLPQSYDKPNKIVQIFTISIVLFLIYGICLMIIAIIKDQRE